MAIQMNFTSVRNGSVVSSSEKFTFAASLQGMDDGSAAYRVNLTGTSASGDQVDRESSIAWVSPDDGRVLMVTMDGHEWVGDNASSESQVLSLFTTRNLLALLNSSTVMPVLDNQTARVGPLRVSTDTYEGQGTLPQYQNLEVTVGSVGRLAIQLVLAANYMVPGSGSVSFGVVSLVSA
jgi:hypothetical protein